MQIAPYSSVIVNGIYWAPNSPKLIRIPDAKNLLQPPDQPWLQASPGCPTLPHRLRKHAHFHIEFNCLHFKFVYAKQTQTKHTHTHTHTFKWPSATYLV